MRANERGEGRRTVSKRQIIPTSQLVRMTETGRVVMQNYLDRQYERCKVAMAKAEITRANNRKEEAGRDAGSSGSQCAKGAKGGR